MPIGYLFLDGMPIIVFFLNVCKGKDKKLSGYWRKTVEKNQSCSSLKEADKNVFHTALT